ncbi:ATP-dependent RNA helicase [Rhynchospora pubera]|uniref:ATP-dependent RNA helicase n=1 Tax=Rhynchospora pubera TaxID=906938 RepID=A0AAV8D988_9POAL|nr:ATP-dependent RNA helicase [Rhynchospora pubera]
MVKRQKKTRNQNPPVQVPTVSISQGASDLQHFNSCNSAKMPKSRDNAGPVREATLIDVGKILEDFRASDANEYTFQPNLSHRERASIHQMCRKIGFFSKSSGIGEQRQLSVYKTKRQKKKEKKAKVEEVRLRFSQQSENVLRELFINYPPGDEDMGGDAGKTSNKKAGKAQANKDSTFCRPTFTKEDVEKKVELLATRIKESEQLQKIVEDRAKLPIASYKDSIISTLENQQVVLISGETGCGKTTQVPQFILDHMWGKGECCKVVCTQPRRISAISVAERISSERGENVGDTVGYKIRLESKGGKNSSIIFCTNGVLLRLLIGRGINLTKRRSTKLPLDDSISEITHIILDEIHERDRFSDFMLAILRDLLPSLPHLRLVLMSATIDADRFSKYFNGCAVIQVPGFTYPVKTFYLEDVLYILKSSMQDDHLNPTLTCKPSNSNIQHSPLNEHYKNALDESIGMALSNDEFDPLLELITTEEDSRIYNYQHSISGVSPLMVFAGKGSIGDVCMLLSFGADCTLKDNSGKTALQWAQQENQTEIENVIKEHMEKGSSESTQEDDLLNKYLSTIDPEHIDTVLIVRLLKKICNDSKEGAILVFLPGWEDINQTREKLLASAFFKDSSRFLILSLHSMIPSVEQKKVFRRPVGGARKIILSTNIAETAVTIDDVVFVIDSGRMKEKSYDPYNNVSTLQSSWISKASMRQREGRAGRCQPGICYHLFSKFRASSLPDFQVPEIKRMPIEELCLQVKLLDANCLIADFLQKTLDPPVPETVRNAIIALQDLGALTDTESLTELGSKLGSLPVHPSRSKMLLFAILMNCLDPALTLACAADYRDPFVIPMLPDEKKRAGFAKAELAGLYGGFSDHLAVVAAYDCWRRAKDKGQDGQFCSRYFISGGTMHMLFNMRRQLQSELVKNGFLPADMSCCSLNAHDAGIIRAVLMAGAYPMVGRLLPKRNNNGRPIVETVSGAKVRLHQHSSNFNLSFKKEVPLIMYDEVTHGDRDMYIKSSSIVGPYPLLLLSNEMVVAPGPDNDDWEGSEEEEEMNGRDPGRGEQIMSEPDNDVIVVVDRWLKYQSTALDVAHIYCLRERLASAILFKVKHPQAVLPPALAASMQAISSILSYESLHLITSDELSDKNQSKKRTGYVQPSGYLRSLLSDKRAKQNNYPSNFHRNHHEPMNYRNTGPAPRQPQPPVHGSGAGNSGGPKMRSFKRHRERVSQ